MVSTLTVDAWNNPPHISHDQIDQAMGSSSVSSRGGERKLGRRARFLRAKRKYKRENNTILLRTVLFSAACLGGIMYYNAGKRGRYVQSVGPEEYDMLGFNADARGFVNGRIMLSEDFDFLDQGIANGADSQIVSSVASDLYGNLVYYDELTESPQRLLTGENATDICAAKKKTQKELDCDARPKCISPEYFDDPFTEDQLRSGSLAFHFLIMIWMFMGLAIVCDDYFEASLEKICESLNLKEDVAGATFMAAGGSAPELFTSVMGVFVSKNDIGFGTIVGSAVFNVLFVIAMCAFVVPNLKVTWWPLARDCISYCIGIIALVGVVIDFEVQHYEAFILLMLYGGYVTIMYFNEQLEEWTAGQLKKSEESNKNMPLWRKSLYSVVTSTPFDLVIYAAIVTNIVCVFYSGPIPTMINNICSALFIVEALLKIMVFTFFGYWNNPMNAFDGVLVVLIIFELAVTRGEDGVAGNLRAARLFRFVRALRAVRIIKMWRAFYKETVDASTQTEEGDTAIEGHKTLDVHGELYNQVTKGSSNQVTPVSGGDNEEVRVGENTVRKAEGKGDSDDTDKDGDGDGDHDDDGDDSDDDDDGPVELFDMGDTLMDKFMWAFKFPLSFAMYFTIPDVNKEMFSGGYWFWVTFFMSIVWIAILAFFMVWMATIIGLIIGIPDPVMGLTLLAAGTSVPDALSSLAVARKGHGDMAVSSSIGSNVFDILIGLPVPWFLATTVAGMDHVDINSDGLNIMVLMLFIMVGLVIVTIRACGWVLTTKLAWMMMSMYGVFMALSLLLEYCLIIDCPCGVAV